ncbi:hypothetical protein BKA70DRAFT_1440470 [Coprinopsis sp. MPI-PUGE-AT-0042]|nr:hypothetical protein BKA70DRAFT_1440470 [Coprinopsis sp. MPI-PUGE-AT-0042]
MYHYLIANYANPEALSKPHWSLIAGVLINRIIAVVSQCYFTYMVFKLCPTRFRWVLGITICVFIAAYTGLGLAFVVLLFIRDTDYKQIHEINRFTATPALIAGVIGEFMIAGSLCTLLRGKVTEFKGTRRIIALVIIYAINRCLLSSISKKVASRP